MQMLMNSFKVRNSLWYFWNKSTLTYTNSGSCPCFLSSFLLSFCFSFHHSLNSFRQIIISISCYDLLQNLLSSLLFFSVDTIDQIDLAIPGHWSCCKFILWTWKITMNLIWFRLHQSIWNVDLTHNFQLKFL